MSNAVKQSAPVIHFEIGCKDSESTGRFAWFSDPEGNMLGLQEPKK